MLAVVCRQDMLDVGFNATRNTRGAPLVIPPLTPPAPFFRVLPSGPIGSLCCDPRILDAAKPSPNSMPRTPGMEKTAWENNDSTESKNGSPSPTGRPETVHSTIPPRLSPSLITSRRKSSREGLVLPNSHIGIPPTSTSFACMSAFTSFLATTPAATIGRVSRPEKCPPPRGSL